ncbi:DUF2335 domain-containing protein [Jiella sp. M17.18]|uniref:DUF2335 domain-containing protein n=1 Tax=Jiella sp. M17.18 TaxID=3234247 RepID=UPI0034DF3B60
MTTPATERSTDLSESSEPHARAEPRLEMKGWIGPLPPPDTLKAFDEVVPGSAERILAAWEGETAHRHAIERAELKIFGLNTILGRVFALIFVLAALGVAAYAATLGAQWFASILSGATILGVVMAFIRISRRGE